MTVIIADRSQITRLGIYSVLRQLNHQFSIRELSNYTKLTGFPYKGSMNLLIISASFLSYKKNPVSEMIDLLLPFHIKILIRDQELPDEVTGVFDEIIEPDDQEKLILRKIDIQISFLQQRQSIRHENSEISKREKEVLRLVAMGLTNKEIAEKLFISSHTVITHRKNITAKLGIKTIAGLTVYAVINKMISFEDIQ